MDYPKIAARLARADIKRIEQTLRAGVTGGLNADEIVRQIIGTAQFDGADGMTALTRRDMMLLARKVSKGTP